jgi:aspartate/glutamate racemase
MKNIGLAGGISLVYAMDYNKFVNAGINLKSGGLNFAEQ